MDDVAAKATSQLCPRMRGRVQSRLRERLQPSPCLRLTSDSAIVTIESERGLVWRVSRSGTAESGAARARGRGRAIPATVTDTAITISGHGDKGGGSYELRRSADGKRLELKVSLEGERLKQPIAYK